MIRTRTDDKIDEVLRSPDVHNLTKLILREAKEKDCVDAYYDVQLAANLLKQRMDEMLGR